MDYKKDRNLLQVAMRAGCKTVADLALFLKTQTIVAA
ncbi:MAG: hypothetical protein RLZZ428_816 [Pseudomonadota bacterium]|jgi:hypothetical protein